MHRAIRVRLVEQLGIDPGELLETTYRQVVAPQPARASARLDSPGTVVGSHSSTLGQSGLVGRERDLSLLTAAIEPAFTGASGLAVVEGEPGVGKTRLLEELDVEATRRGARVIWAHCHDGDGTPALWPWVQVVRALLDDRSDAARADWLSAGLGELLDPSTDALTATVFQGGDSQFRMFQRVVDLIGRAAVTRPLVVLLDDLQWADIATLHLYSHLLGQLHSRRRRCVGPARPGADAGRRSGACARRRQQGARPSTLSTRAVGPARCCRTRTQPDGRRSPIRTGFGTSTCAPEATRSSFARWHGAATFGSTRSTMLRACPRFRRRCGMSCAIASHTSTPRPLTFSSSPR